MLPWRIAGPSCDYCEINLRETKQHEKCWWGGPRGLRGNLGWQETTMTCKHLPQDFVGTFLQKQDFQPNAQRSLSCFIQVVKDRGPYKAKEVAMLATSACLITYASFSSYQSLLSNNYASSCSMSSFPLAYEVHKARKRFALIASI